MISENQNSYHASYHLCLLRLLIYHKLENRVDFDFVFWFVYLSPALLRIENSQGEAPMRGEAGNTRAGRVANVKLRHRRGVSTCGDGADARAENNSRLSFHNEIMILSFRLD